MESRIGMRVWCFSVSDRSEGVVHMESWIPSEGVIHTEARIGMRVFTESHGVIMESQTGVREGKSILDSIPSLVLFFFF